MTTIRYRLGDGERFTIEAATEERITVDGTVMMDVAVSFVLACEVVGNEDGIVHIAGRFEDAKIAGRAPAGMLPDVGSLQGRTIAVRKGLDGRVHSVEHAEPLEAMFGGLTARNALTWFAAVFPAVAVEPGATWTDTDRWVLRSDQTPLGIDLPLRPAVDVSYGYNLLRLDAREADIDLCLAFGGRTSCSRVGLELGADGGGEGRVVVDLARGKLRSSTKHSVLELRPRAIRRGALALPPLRVERRSEAGFRA